jgi:hypothetical protein
MQSYSPTIEEQMRKFYQSLSEKDRRRYAAVEAEKVGHGGITYISKVLGCAHSTIATGIKELKALPAAGGYDPRLRQAGGGRKAYSETHPDIDAAFLEVIDTYTAGDPMQAEVRWTNLSHPEIAERLLTYHDIQVSETVVEQLLKKHQFTRRKAQKKRL